MTSHIHVLCTHMYYVLETAPLLQWNNNLRKKECLKKKKTNFFLLALNFSSDRSFTSKISSTALIISLILTTFGALSVTSFSLTVFSSCSEVLSLYWECEKKKEKDITNDTLAACVTKVTIARYVMDLGT